MLLENKVAVVTGSGRGIGGAIARGFAREGAAVVLVSRTMAQLREQEARIREHGDVPVLSVECDVSDPAQVEELVRRAVEAFGRIDVLANCAGITMVAQAAADGSPDSGRTDGRSGRYGRSRRVSGFLDVRLCDGNCAESGRRLAGKRLHLKQNKFDSR
jgi:NAD(P)-dependent dehydrogenase (short-subunit alcohol dehydrogenase family)